MSQISAREFNQDVSAAKRAAEQEPVIITDRGRPSHVLMSISDYAALRGRGRNIAERLRMEEGDYVEYNFPRLEGEPRAVAW